MANVDVYKLRHYIHELEECTTRIQRKKTMLDNDIEEMIASWNDEVFWRYMNQYKQISKDIDIFISQSKRIQAGLVSKVSILTRYLNT